MATKQSNLFDNMLKKGERKAKRSREEHLVFGSELLFADRGTKVYRYCRGRGEDYGLES